MFYCNRFFSNIYVSTIYVSIWVQKSTLYKIILFLIWNKILLKLFLSDYVFSFFQKSINSSSLICTSHYLICIHYLTVKLLTYNFIYFLTSLCGSQCELKFNFRNTACHIAKFSTYVFLKEYVSASPHNNFY